MNEAASHRDPGAFSGRLLLRRLPTPLYFRRRVGRIYAAGAVGFVSSRLVYPPSQMPTQLFLSVVPTCVAARAF